MPRQANGQLGSSHARNVDSYRRPSSHGSVCKEHARGPGNVRLRFWVLEHANVAHLPGLGALPAVPAAPKGEPVADKLEHGDDVVFGQGLELGGEFVLDLSGVLPDQGRGVGVGGAESGYRLWREVVRGGGDEAAERSHVCGIHGGRSKGPEADGRVRGEGGRLGWRGDAG